MKVNIRQQLRHIFHICFQQLRHTLLIILSLTSLLSYSFLKLADKLIISSYTLFLKTNLPSLSIFYFHFDIFAYNYLFIGMLNIISSLIPLLLMKKIMPAKIVNNKNV
ncbi:MAG: hypothetical protein MR270_04075 [Erysipelotrichaceae bacterium]|nr:hypothetical protein [Erysipelotrichaceae bacterium]